MFLFDETPIFSNPILVRDIGLDEALVLHQLNYWIEVNRKTGKIIMKGDIGYITQLEAGRRKILTI